VKTRTQIEREAWLRRDRRVSRKRTRQLSAAMPSIEDQRKQFDRTSRQAVAR
jgi:hypothetical protein